MTHLQLVLLHSVKFAPEPIYWLGVDDKFEQEVWFGFPITYNESEELVVAMYELCQNNDMVLHERKKEDRAWVSIENPSPEIIRSGFSDNSIYYRLTPKGGARWEELFKVDWDKYVDISCSSEDDEVFNVALTSSDLENLELAFDREFASEYNEIELGKRTLEKKENWEVTYWKTLPLAYKDSRKLIPKQILEKPISTKLGPSGWPIKWYDESLLGF